MPDPLISLLFEDDDIVAINKPYGLNTHTNESKAGNEDFVEHGLIEIFERQLGRTLHIVHRLDQTTTGVVIFAKSQEAAKKYAEFFFQRQVKKTYLFLTASASSKPAFEIDQDIVHKAKELPAETSFKLVKKTSGLELWQAQPHTGRNHQIRIHAQAGGVPLLGDERYGGRRFPFLCLHNRKIEFPNGVVIEAAPPLYFDDPALLDDPLRAILFHEADRRTRLFGSVGRNDQCFRLVHKLNEAADFGFAIDQFGDVLDLWLQDGVFHDVHRQAFIDFANQVRKPILVHSTGAKGGAQAEQQRSVLYPSGSDAHPVSATWVAKENTVKYELHADVGPSVGLFLDQRLQRKWVLDNAREKSVLNLFASTCGFGLAAALGGASQVTSVDISKSALERGARNFELNGVDPNQSRFLRRDSLVYLATCQKKGLTFDLVICHAPAFFRGEKGTFHLSKGLESLLASCLKCLSPRGELLFLTNSQTHLIGDIHKSILNVKRALSLPSVDITCLLPSLDFELVGERPRLKSFLVRTPS